MCYIVFSLSIEKECAVDSKSLRQRQRNFVFKDPSVLEPVKRNQVHGVNHILPKLEQIASELKKFRPGKSIISSGLLFYGPKGCGKTYLSRFLATIGEVRFVDMRSFPRPGVAGREHQLAPEDIKEMYRLGRLYVEKTKKAIIFFIDEIEKLDEDIFLELRMQIDGITERSEGIFLICTSAVESPDDIDEGLFRAGRIGIHIPITYPGIIAQEEMLLYYIVVNAGAENVGVDKSINIKNIRHLLGEKVTPAGIRQVSLEAVKEAASQKQKILQEEHLAKKCLARMVGFIIEDDLDEEGRWQVAVHEAGHAACACLLGFDVLVVTTLYTINEHGKNFGKTIDVYPDGALTTVETKKRDLIKILGGIEAEKFFDMPAREGEISDRFLLTSEAQSLVDNFLCGKELQEKFGPIMLNREMAEYSESLREAEERDVARLVKWAEKEAGKLIRKIGKNRIRKIAGALIKKRTLLQRDLDELLK